MNEDATELAAEARALFDEDTEGVQPGDFADVLRRAAARPDARLSVQDLERGEVLAQCSDEELRARVNFGTTEDFLDDASAFASGQEVDEIPPLPQVQPARAGRSIRVVLGIMLPLAAALLLIPWLGGALERAGRVGAVVPTYESTLDQAQSTATGGVASPRVPKRSPATRPQTPLPPEPATATEVEVEPAPKAGTKQAPARASKPSKAERLALLDAAARAAWKRGDLAKAQAEFEALVRAGGRRDIVDIAFGDLFSLAKQRGGKRARQRLWRQYAKRFPNGRYIDDARAGLCRTAPKLEQTDCWAAYLRDRPRGTYRDHAREVVARSE